MRKKDDDKITRIYHAAVKLINTEGFQGTSISKIAKEVKLMINLNMNKQILLKTLPGNHDPGIRKISRSFYWSF
jgi:hypothetical protein